jgi:hypothetical protein
VSLERRTPLRRTGGPKRKTELSRGNSQLSRGGRINPMSRKRLAATEARAEVRRQVFARDGRCLLRGIDGAGPCLGRRTPHHVLKASAGGPYSVENLVQLCAHHNDWIETTDGQLLALSVGLWCRHGDTLEACWRRMTVLGLVTYDPEGTPLPCP